MHFNLQGISAFLKGAISESTGEPSFGRLGALAVVISTIGWVTFVVLKTHVIPDLSGPTLFLSSGTSATYGANKLAGAFKKDPKNEETGKAQ